METGHASHIAGPVHELLLRAEGGEKISSRSEQVRHVLSFNPEF
jgi:hypothetical protein